MKRILAASSIIVVVLLGLPGTASAAPSDAQCFGQVHKTINTVGALGFTNVGDVVKVLGGQGKNDTARDICAG